MKTLGNFNPCVSKFFFQLQNEYHWSQSRHSLYFYRDLISAIHSLSSNENMLEDEEIYLRVIV